MFAGKFGYKKYVENLPIDKMSLELNKNNISDYFGVETVETTDKWGNKKTPTIMYSKMYDDGWIYLPEESDIEVSIKFYETDKQWELGAGQYKTLGEYDLYCTVYKKKTVNATFGSTRGNAIFVNSKCVKEYTINENGRHIVLINGQEYYDDNYEFYDIPWCGRPY